MTPTPTPSTTPTPTATPVTAATYNGGTGNWSDPNQWTPNVVPNNGTAGQNGLGTVLQGSFESSNVNVVEELVNMIETQRAYEMNSKAISTADQMLEYVNNQL